MKGRWLRLWSMQPAGSTRDRDGGLVRRTLLPSRARETLRPRLPLPSRRCGTCIRRRDACAGGVVSTLSESSRPLRSTHRGSNPHEDRVCVYAPGQSTRARGWHDVVGVRRQRLLAGNGLAGKYTRWHAYSSITTATVVHPATPAT